MGDHYDTAKLLLHIRESLFRGRTPLIIGNVERSNDLIHDLTVAFPFYGIIDNMETPISVTSEGVILHRFEEMEWQNRYDLQTFNECWCRTIFHEMLGEGLNLPQLLHLPRILLCFGNPFDIWQQYDRAPYLPLAVREMCERALLSTDVMYVARPALAAAAAANFSQWLRGRPDDIDLGGIVNRL